MKKFRFLAIAMAAFMTISFVGCGDKDKDLDYTGSVLKNGESIEILDMGTDQTAAYPLHFKLTLKNGFLYAENMSSKPTEAAFSYHMPDIDCPTSASIVDCGEIKGLTDLTTYPIAGYADSIAATEAHGYVIMAKGNAKVDMWENENLHDPVAQFMRIWLEEQTDEGFKLRYEWPWVIVAE